MVERYSHDVSVGTAHARGVTESENAQVQALESHVEKFAELGHLTKDQAMTLTGEASIGGGMSRLLRFGTSGTATWRGQTIEMEAWNRMQEYDRQHGVTDLWSGVQEASRRYSTSTGDSELASLDESLGANLTRMQRFEDRAALSYGESEQWSEQAAAVRADAQSIERDLSQPFFAWLSEREGTDGRPIGAGGAMRLASPQTPEDAEALREHASAFIAERFPAPAGPDPASVGGMAAYETVRGEFGAMHASGIATAHAGQAEGVRDRAATAGAPEAGEVGAKAGTHRAAAEDDLAQRGTVRASRTALAEDAIRDGRAEVTAERDGSFGEHAAEGVPIIGDRLAGKLYGTARNNAPDMAGQPVGEGTSPRRPGADGSGP